MKLAASWSFEPVKVACQVWLEAPNDMTKALDILYQKRLDYLQQFYLENQSEREVAVEVEEQPQQVQETVRKEQE